jgi:hypothetical protein
LPVISKPITKLALTTPGKDTNPARPDTPIILVAPRAGPGPPVLPSDVRLRQSTKKSENPSAPLIVSP